MAYIPYITLSRKVSETPVNWATRGGRVTQTVTRALAFPVSLPVLTPILRVSSPSGFGGRGPRGPGGEIKSPLLYQLSYRVERRSAHEVSRSHHHVPVHPPPSAQSLRQREDRRHGPRAPRWLRCS